MSTHVHVHVRTGDAFEESKHPRGQPGNKGEFAKGRGGGKLSRAKAAVETAAKRTELAAKNFSKEDYTILKNNLLSPHSEPRKKAAHVIRGFAKSVPQLVKSHLREEKHKVLGAAGALRSMAKGQKPTPAELKGLRQFSVSVVISSVSFVAHGDPTGTIGHLLGALAQEFAGHAMMEHGAKTAVGVGRAAVSAVRGGKKSPAPGRRYKELVHDADGLSDEDYGLLSDYLNTLADKVESAKIPTKTVEHLLVGHKG